jgi:predicted small secreted protein
MRTASVILCVVLIAFFTIAGCIPTVADVQGHPLPHNAATY